MKKVFLSVVLMFFVSFAFAEEIVVEKVSIDKNLHKEGLVLNASNENSKCVQKAGTNSLEIVTVNETECFILSCRVVCFEVDRLVTADEVEAIYDHLDYIFC